MLAAVLGHEIAHVMERHSVENLGVSALSQESIPELTH
jgi:Zn-dependent protease with chaperone function